MSKKPIKPNATVQKPKPKQFAAAAASNSNPTQITTVHSFENLCATEDFVLIWLDEKIAPNHTSSLDFIDQLKSIAHKIDVFNDFDACVAFVKKIKKGNVLFIVSDLLGQKAVAALHPLKTIIAIFIFSRNKSTNGSWVKKWTKIRGVFTEPNGICQSLNATVKQFNDETPDMSVIAPHDITQVDIKRLDQSLMYTKLIKDILLKKEYDQNSFEDFIKFYRKKYADNQEKLNGVDILAAHHRQRSAIWCYTLETFFYNVINESLRNQDFDMIVRIGFFIKKLDREITDLHTAQSKTKRETFVVFRGQGMSEEQFKLFKRSEGGLLSFNNFLSTSTEKHVAIDFLDRALNGGKPFGIFFSITVDPSILPVSPASSEWSAWSIQFAFIEEFTSVKGEKEVLFSMLSIFKIERIEQSTSDTRVWNAKITLASMDDKDLTKLTEQIQTQIEGPTPLHRLGALLIRLNKLDKAEEVCRQAMESQRTPLEEAHIYHQLGQIESSRGNYLKAITLYIEASTIYIERLGSEHQNIATIYCDLGSAYRDLGKYDQALKYYQKALPIYQTKLPDNHLIIGICYNNIADVYENMNDYQQALVFYEESYQMYDKQLSPIDPHRAMYYNNVGLVYLNLKRYSEALLACTNAVRIGRLTLPDDHPNLQTYIKSLKRAEGKASE